MKHPHRHSAMLAVLAVSSFVTAAACGDAQRTGTGGASTTTRATTVSTTSSGAGGCGGASEVFGACTGPNEPDGGAGAPGTACETDTDCQAACCPCAHGQTQYAYSACTCGKCASICDPTNDTRAPVCADAGPAVVGCLSCAQILNVALANGDQLGPLACAGAAPSWTALDDCAASACGSACPGVMPTNACVTCVEQTDAMGGCATELTACMNH